MTNRSAVSVAKTFVRAFVLALLIGSILTDPATAFGQGTFAATGSMIVARSNPTLTVLQNGQVLVAGGYNGSTPLQEAEVFNPATGTWTATTGSMTTARYTHTATLLNNGLVLITGGVVGPSFTPLATAELYNPATGTFTATTGNMTTARENHTATLLQNGTVLIAGGNNNSGPLGSAEIYNPGTGTFTATTGSMNTSRYVPTATLLNDGTVLVAGGITTPNPSYVATAEIYNPTTETFSYTSGPMSTPRGYAESATLGNGEALVVGGGSPSLNANADLYNPATKTFSSVPMAIIANGPETVLNNGLVLVAGGYDGTNYLASAQVYNPTTGTFSVTGSMTTPRDGAAAALLQNGQVLVAGGYDPSYLASTELYTDLTANVCPAGQSTPAPCSATMSLTFDLPTAITIGSIQAVTQGATGLDFSVSSAGTCTGTIVGSYCTMSVNFAPLAPGLRMGAVEVFDTGGNVLATQFISGVGQGPAAGFNPATQSVVQATGLQAPSGVAVDAAGNIFISDENANDVVKVPPSGSQTTIASGLSQPYDVAVDGAGNVFIADFLNNRVLKVPPVGAQTTVGSGMAHPSGVAVDGAGDVYITNENSGQLVEVTPGGTQTTIAAAGLSFPYYPAVDAAGDVFFVDAGNQRVLEVTPGVGQSTVLTSSEGPNGVAVDAAGDIFISTQNNGQIVEIPLGGTPGTVFTSGLSVPAGVAVDGLGNLFIADHSNGRVVKIATSQGALNFGSVNEGSLNGVQTGTLQNIGNQPLNSEASPEVTVTGPYFLSYTSGNNYCTAASSFSLEPGQSCDVGVIFKPSTSGPLTSTAVVTDNALNGAPATQTINLNGTGVAIDYTLTLTSLGSGSGAVTDSTEAMNCTITNGTATGTCAESYTSGQLVTLTATANSSAFAGWGGACASYGTNPQCQVTMSAAQSVTVTFNPLNLAFTAPTSPVNTITGVQTATVYIINSGTPATISVVTQGATGKDFNFAPAGTCATGTAYTAAQTCTVNYTFTPLAPGGRKGAVVLTDGSGNVLGTTYLSGIGTGPQGLFDTAPQTLSVSSLAVPRGLSVDGNGNLYAFETCSGTCSGTLDEFPAGTSNKTQLATLPDTLYTAATAVDGAGNVFVTTNQTPNPGILYELVGGKGPANPVATIPDADNNLEVDGSGNLFFSGYHNGNEGAIYEIPAGSTQVTTLIPSGAALNQRFIGMAIDAAGNLYAADYNNNILYELPAGTTNLVTLASGGDLSGPDGVAVDPAGNIYVTNVNGSAVIRYAAGTYTPTLLPEAGQRGITLDSAGNMYTVTSDSTIAGYARTQASPLTFANTNVGTTSDSQQGDIFENGGNSGLVITVYSATAPYAVGGQQNTCATGTLAPGTSCVVGATFTPTTVGAVAGTASIIDNNLNLAGTGQTISLSGAGVAAAGNYSLTVSPIGSGTGTVTDNTSVISCQGANGSASGTCAASYQTGSSVTLTANPAPGSVFLGWGGACTGFASTCQVSVIEAENVTASFDQQNFGGINVCQPGQSTPAPCNTSIPVTINIPTTTTIGVIQVVTQGATGLDFTQASGGTCTGTITGGTSCVVNVQFAPISVGLRMGAVKLYNAAGSLVASAPIYGIGQAPLAAFSPSAQLTVNTGTPLNYPNGLLTDAAGNLFIADGDNNRVLRVAPNGAVTTVASGLVLPQGMAEDGAGDLFIADNGNQVVEIPAGCATSACQQLLPKLGLQSELGVAVDPVGNLFVGDFLDGKVAEIPANGGPQIIVYNPTGCGNTTGCSDPVDLTTDSVGNLYVADYGLQTVAEVPVGCTTNSCIKTIGTGWNRPDDVAVDAAGDVFVADQGLNEIVEVPAGCSNAACQVVLVSGVYTVAVKVDAAGDLFFDNVTTNQILEITRSLPPSLSFALTNSGSTSADSPMTVSIQNIGNNTLAGALGVSTLAPNFLPSGPCASFSLAPGAACSENLSFTPQTTGYFTGTATFSDDTLNLAASVVLQPVNMTGIGGQNGQAVTTSVPDVVGLSQSAAVSALTAAGLSAGSVSMAPSSIVPAGSVIASNPPANTVVNLSSSVNLQVSNGQSPQAATPNPLSILNNWFVTGDVATAGVTLRGAPVNVNKMVTGTINIPASSGPGNPGVPTGADLIEGLLYWTTIENSQFPSGSSGTFLGFPVYGQQIGKDLPYTDPVTSTAGTLRVYRADVNTWFQNRPDGTRVGSGNFAVSLPGPGFPASGGATGGVLLNEGASLVTIYRVLSPNFPLKAVVIYDGSAIPATSSSQNMQGMYDALGGASASGEVTSIFVDSTGWNNSSGTFALGAADHYNAPLNAGAAYSAVVLSTPVNNPDNDAILHIWKLGPPAGDFHGGQPGYYDVKTGQWVGLPGAAPGQKDLFVQLDYMCGAVITSGPGAGTCTGENLFPAPDPSGNDPLAMVQQAFANSGVTLHLQIGNAVPEDTCTDSQGQLCQFPGEPGVVGWKNSVEYSKVWPRNFASCASGGDCSPRFPYGQKDSYHYVLFGHSLAIPAWNSRYGSLMSINAVAGGTTTIVTTDRGTGINKCPSRITIAGILSMPSLNGVYNTSSCPDTSTIIIPTPAGVTNWTYTYSTNTPPEPIIGITSGTVTSISGYSDLGGADSAVTLALWETAPNQDMSKRANVIAGTLFHELGHTIGLPHGGLYYDTPGSYTPTFEANCKPNYQSDMNYLFQLDGVGPTGAVAYSNQTLTMLNQATLGSVAQLVDTDSGFIGAPASFATSTWYVPTAPSTTASPATLHCDGTPLGVDTGYRINGPIAPITPAWSNGQNITFDGQAYTTLRGYNDIANIDLRQVGATGGEFASLANLLSFGASAAPLSVGAGGNVTLGNGGTVTLTQGGNVTLTQGGNVALGSAGTITMTQGGNVTLTQGGNVTLAQGGNVTLTQGGNVTLTQGGTITLTQGGSVTIPSTGGSYTIPSGGGTVTLTQGGNVTLAQGGNVTLAQGGNITLTQGGNVTLTQGGNVTLTQGGNITLTQGGTITLTQGGNVTLTQGGNVTLTQGGNITLTQGGNVTLAQGGNVTLAQGGNVTVGGSENLASGSGGNVTLTQGGNVTLAQGGNVTLAQGGNVTLTQGGNVTLTSGGNITLTQGGNVTLTQGGNVTLTQGGTITLTQGGSVTIPSTGGSYTIPSGGGTITLTQGGNVTLAQGGNVTLTQGGNITLTQGGNVTLTQGGNVTLTQGGVVTLGNGGNITLGEGGNVTLTQGGSTTLGSGGATTTELTYDTANSVVRPPAAPTETTTQQGVRVAWNAPAFGVVQTYTVSRSVNGGPPVVIGSVGGVNGYPPATTFTDTNPSPGTLTYTIATTLVPDQGSSTPRQSPPSVPAVVTYDQTIVLGALQSSYVISSTPVPVTATITTSAPSSDPVPEVKFTASGSCSIVSGSQSILGGVSSANISLDSTGSCTITASQSGATNFNPADPVSESFSILPQGSNLQSQTINFLQLPNVQYGQSPLQASAIATSNLPVSFSASGPCNNTAINSQIAITGVGRCKVTAMAPGNTAYSAASVTQSFNISPAVLTVAATNLASPYGQPLPALTYTLTGYVYSDATANPPVVSGTPSLTTTATSSSAPGNYPITVANGNLAAANYDFLFVPGTLTIQHATQTITFTQPAPASAPYKGTFPVAATSTSNLAVTLSVDTASTSVCSLANGTVTMNSATGTCTIDANQVGNADYTAAMQVKSSAAATRAAQTISFAQPASPVTYGVSPVSLSATSTSSLTVAFTVDASSTAAATISGSTLTVKGAGTLVIDASQAGNTNYMAAAQVQRTIVVKQATLTVTANNLSRAYGAANPTLTVTYTGFVPGDNSSMLTGSPSVSTTATTSSLPGSYPISVSQGTLAAANYTFNFVNGTLTVTPTGSVPPSGTACNGAYSGTFSGNLTVSNGQTCVFVSGGTTGSITESGGNLVLNGATVGNGMTINGGTFTIGPSTTIKGNVTIQSMPSSAATNQVCGSTITGNLVFLDNRTAVLIGSNTPSCAGNNVKGTLQVQSNSATTTIYGNTVGANLQDMSNTGATQVYNNVITKSLQCQSNSSITGGGNTAASKSGQCATF